MTGGAPPFDSRPPSPDRPSCPRCGFTVETTTDRLRELFETHVIECPFRPSAGVRRALKKEVEKARFLYGEEAAREAAERVLAGAA